MAVSVVTRESTQLPRLVRHLPAVLSTSLTRFHVSQDESELALEFPGPHFVPIVATIVVPSPLTSVRASYMANVTVDFAGLDIAADTFGQIHVGKAWVASGSAAPMIEITSQSNITVGELYVGRDAPALHFSACSHGVLRVRKYVAPEASGALTLEAKNMGIVIVEELWAPRCRELVVRAAEQGHVVTRRGLSGPAEVYSGTGSVASLGHAVSADSHVFADSSSYASLNCSGANAYADCNSGSLVQIVGAKHLERTQTMGCWIFQRGELGFDPTWCYSSGGRWVAACALMPHQAPISALVHLEGINASLGSLQWLETGGIYDPDSPEASRALEMLVFKNAEWYTGVHNVIHRYDRGWEQEVLKQQLAAAGA